MFRTFTVAVCLLAAACVGKDTAKPGDDLRNFHALTGLSAAKKFAHKDAELLSIRGQYVRSDGTIDTEADYRPYVKYEFLRPAPEDESVPVGAPGRGTGYEQVTVTVIKPGWTHVQTGNKEYSYKRLGMDRTVRSASKSRKNDVVAAPQCPFSLLWQTAIEEGVSGQAVATIDYDGEYDFRISDIGVHIQFDQSCDVIQAQIAPAEEGDGTHQP